VAGAAEDGYGRWGKGEGVPLGPKWPPFALLSYEGF